MYCDDPFIEKLRRIHALTEESCTLLNRHLVNDLTEYLPQEGCSTVLLLESPHKSEVRKGYPLAGSAGATVTGAFIGTMGDILHGRCFDDRAIRFSVFKRMGVMNVSRLPLKKSAYSVLNNNQGSLYCPKDLFIHFCKIKKHFEQGKTSQLASEIEKTKYAIKNDLKHRIRQLDCQKSQATICYVACGMIAEKFLEMVHQDMPSISILPAIPHPSSRAHPWFQDGELDTQVQTISNRFRPFNADSPSSTS